MITNNFLKELLGETIGTFILVFIGTATVALEILYGTFGELIPIALLWGLGVAIAIFTTRSICPAHFNPAVTIAMFLNKSLSLHKMFFFWLAQFIGAMLAGGMVYWIFNDAILEFQPQKNVETARMFGEYYNVSTLSAFLFEMLGTVFLVFFIFVIVNFVKNSTLVPILIGFVVSIAIVFIAPYTQCGINPARDLGPRLVSYFNGWNDVAFSQSPILVYVLAPLLGGVVGYYAFKLSPFTSKIARND